MAQSDYLKYRGKCKEYSEQACKLDPSLTLVRGHYFCPVWGTEEPHWWCVREDGTIHDPTKLQFGSAGQGIYTPFDGYIECADCGTRKLEEEAVLNGNYAFCCNRCAYHFVGI